MTDVEILKKIYSLYGEMLSTKGISLYTRSHAEGMRNVIRDLLKEEYMIKEVHE